VSQVSSLQVSHFAHKCRKCQESILPQCLCHTYKDIKRTLETSQTFDLEEEERLTGFINLFPFERTTKFEFLDESTPLYLSYKCWRPPIDYMGCYNTFFPFWRSATAIGSVGAPLYLTRERYNALTALLEERYLFWAAVGLLRRMRGISSQYLKVVGFESLVEP
jgi:hypothetical protein